MDAKELGDKGEKMACEYLVSKGYKILGRNYRISFGEIDVIARKKWKLFGKNDKTIHFVEVKALAGGTSFYPEEHVNRAKKEKYKKLIEVWMDKNGFAQDYPCQMDIIAILGDNVEFFENINLN